MLCRPFLDLEGKFTLKPIAFYTDASRNSVLGYGCFFDGRWTFGTWELGYIEKFCPSIEYLELYAVYVGIWTWQDLLKNTVITIFCDNTAVRDMINSTSSKCKHCMVLIRKLVMNNLLYNRKVYVEYISSNDNVLADSLSRGNFKEFWKNAPANTRKYPDAIPTEIWPPSKLWGKLVFTF